MASETHGLPHLLTIRETALALRASRPTVYRKIARGDIPAVRLGDGAGPLRVPADDLARWLFREERKA